MRGKHLYFTKKKSKCQQKKQKPPANPQIRHASGEKEEYIKHFLIFYNIFQNGIAIIRDMEYNITKK